ncbi:MAG: hypothetical protein OSA81_10600 [Longimicrobiales bacterium]|nr:hypothetical protein [Longimicrobiales bacterium]
MRTSYLLIVSTCVSLTGCQPDTVLGFAIGDISGLWVASSYVYSDVSGEEPSVDLVARDGAMFTAVVDYGPRPPIISTTFADGAGMEVSGGGTVDITVGTLTIEGDVFDIVDNDVEMTLTGAAMMYDFDSGARAAVLTIQLGRI